MTRCGNTSRRGTLTAVVLLAMLQLTGPRLAWGNTDQLAAGSSSHHVKRSALSGIPLVRMTDETQQRIRDVVEKPSFFRRLPVTSLDTDPEYFQFLIRQPEVIVSIWEVMGVSRMSTQRLGRYQIRTNDGAGTTSDLELVYGDDSVHVYYGRGAYSGPLLRRPVTGRCVFVVHHRAESKPTNGFDLTCQVDVFLKVDNATASLITKSLQPLVGSTADHNFQESLRFVERLTRTTRNNGPGVKALGRQLKIDSEVRQGFDEVIDLVFQRAILQRGIDSPDGVAFPASPAISAEQPTAYVPGNAPAGSRPANSQMVDSIDAGQATTQVAKPPISEPNFNASGASNWLPAGSVRSRLTDAPLGSTVAPAGYRIPARGQQAPSYPAGNVFRGR